MRNSLTSKEKEAIEHYRGEKGWSYQRIAMVLNRPVGTVESYCLREVIEPPSVKQVVSNPPSSYTYTRNGIKVRGYTKEEDEIILSMLKAGQRNAAICRALDRKHNSIQARITILERRKGRGSI